MVSWAQYPKPSGGWGDSDYVKSLNLYNYEDPTTAYDMFLRDSGVSPSAANPFTQTLRRAAAPLATAYASEWARHGQSGAAWPTRDPKEGFETPYDYATYLGSAMSDDPRQTQGRGVYGALQRSRDELPNLITAVRGENTNTDPNVTKVNPFLGSMAERLMEDNGMGTVNYMSQLAAPMMAPQLRQAYRNQLIQRQQNAYRAQLNATDPMAAGNDIWKYMLGM